MKGGGWLYIKKWDMSRGLAVIIAYSILFGFLIAMFNYFCIIGIDIGQGCNKEIFGQTPPLDCVCEEHENETAGWDYDILDLCEYRCDNEYPMTYEAILEIETPTREEVLNFIDNAACFLGCFDEAEITEEVCTNEVWHADCDSDPDTCNERHGIKLSDIGCIEYCEKIASSCFLCDGVDVFWDCFHKCIPIAIEGGFKCVELVDQFGDLFLKDKASTSFYRADDTVSLFVHFTERSVDIYCTKSRITFNSKEACEGAVS